MLLGLTWGLVGGGEGKEVMGGPFAPSIRALCDFKVTDTDFKLCYRFLIGKRSVSPKVK